MTTKKTLSLVFVGLALNVFLFQTSGNAFTKEDRLAEKVRAGIAKIGAGKDSRVRVKLKDKTKVAGYVSEISEDTFTVVNKKTNVATKIEYRNVKQVQGRNISTGAAIAIAIGIAVALGVIIALVWK